MNEETIPERTQQLIAKTDETRQLIAKVGKLLKGPAEIALVGSTAIVGLAASPGLLPGIAAVMGFGAYFWQRENQNNSLHKLEQQIQRTGASLEESTLNFDEFMELFIQFMEIASKSAFEEKQNYLVNLFVNSVVSSTIPFSGKQTLFRLHSQISLEEIQVLKVIYDIEIKTHRKSRFVSVKEVTKELGWKEEEAFVTCEALAQLFLLRDGMIVSDQDLELSDGSEPKHYAWQITELAKRFIQWIIEEVPSATAAQANTPESTDSAEKTAWSQLTAEQFFSGYSEADAIYDTI
ncbi:MAG: hypothetical protein LDL41_12890 [Coleofasciculus sp. S288]|nr:hypothetical protein [Coleofasciculus sp. S288]